MRIPSTTSQAVSDVLQDTHDQARRFADVDADGNQQLDFDEFYALMPEKVRSDIGTGLIREWFDAADADHSGELSISEYFLWSMQNATEKHGGGVLRAIFSKYDPDASGRLDMYEFQRVCDDAGFGLVAHNIFRALDPNHSGTIEYGELERALKSGKATDERTQRLLSTLVQKCVSPATYHVPPATYPPTTYPPAHLPTCPPAHLPPTTYPPTHLPTYHSLTTPSTSKVRYRGRPRKT